MKCARKFVFALLLLPLIVLQGCNKKKASVPPKMQAPTVAVALPDEIPLDEAPAEPAKETAKTPEPPPAAKPKPKKTTRTASTTKKTAPPATATATQPPPPAQQATNNNNQTVANLRPPAAPDTAIAAAIPSEQVLHQKEDTTRMVDATENALKSINRQLNDEEKNMRAQVQSFLQQSRKATSDGDYERAFNLAKKAQLLAEALIKK